MELERLKRDVLKLPWQDRLRLAEHLLASLHQAAPEPLPAQTRQDAKKIELDQSVAESFQRLRDALENSLRS